MSLLVVGTSHRTAPVELLEKLALEPPQVEKLVHAVHLTGRKPGDLGDHAVPGLAPGKGRGGDEGGRSGGNQ